MRVLAAEDRVQACDVALPGERFEIMRNRHQIGFRRQLVGGMSPVAAGENAELAAVDESLQALLHVGEIARAGLRVTGDGLRERRSRCGIGLQRGNDIHPVERMQMIKVHDMIVHVLRSDHQIADEIGVCRNLVGERIFDRAHGGYAVHQRADATDALREAPCLTRITPAQDDLDAAHHRARRISRLDRAGSVGFGLDPQMSLDPGDRIDDDALCHGSGP